MTSSEAASSGWRLGPRLPSHLTPCTVLAHDDGSGLVFGYVEAANLSQRRAHAVRISAGGQGTLALDLEGWFVAAFANGNDVVAVRARPGPVFDRLRSRDGGATWSAPTPGAATSVTQVVATGPDETWVLGANCLGRWRGDRWEDMPPPSPMDHTRVRLFNAGGTALLATPSGLYLWREARGAWGLRGLDGAHVRGMASPFVAARGPGGNLRIGRLEMFWVDWIGELHGDADVAALAWAPWRRDDPTSALAVQLLLVPHAPDVHPGLILVRSAPSGGFVVEQISVPPDASWAGVSGARGVLALTVDRRPLQCGVIA